MAKCRKPDEKEIQELREQALKDDRRWILNPAEVTISDEQRMKNYAHEVMSKHESKFGDQWQDRQIIASGEVEPEAIDIRALYPRPDLRWMIYKNGQLYTFRFLSGERIQFEVSFAKI